jgi:putative endonuclease
MPRRAWIYICASLSRTLYIGVTSDLPRRIAQHRTRASGFTTRYRVDRLVYLEEAPDMRSAIAREKHLKRWARWKKVRLIDAANDGWLDLARDWFTM